MRRARSYAPAAACAALRVNFRECLAGGEHGCGSGLRILQRALLSLTLRGKLRLGDEPYTADGEHEVVLSYQQRYPKFLALAA